MTSTLNDDSSTIKMDHVQKKQVIEIFKKGFTYQQVSDELKERYCRNLSQKPRNSCQQRFIK